MLFAFSASSPSMVCLHFSRRLFFFVVLMIIIILLFLLLSSPPSHHHLPSPPAITTSLILSHDHIHFFFIIIVIFLAEEVTVELFVGHKWPTILVFLLLNRTPAVHEYVLVLVENLISVGTLSSFPLFSSSLLLFFFLSLSRSLSLAPPPPSVSHLLLSDWSKGDCAQL